MRFSFFPVQPMGYSSAHGDQMSKQRKPGIVLIEPGHPFYKPLWRRITIVAVCALWLIFEVFVSKSSFWIMIAGALLVYTGWTLLFAWKDEAPKP
jgi:hypothetical protein